MIPKLKDLRPIRRGDTWRGVEFVVRNKATGEPLDLTGVTVTIPFKLDPDSDDAALTLTNLSGGGVTLTPLDGKWRIDPFKPNLAPATYHWSTRTDWGNGETHTYFAGTIEVQ